MGGVRRSRSCGSSGKLKRLNGMRRTSSGDAQDTLRISEARPSSVGARPSSMVLMDESYNLRSRREVSGNSQTAIGASRYHGIRCFADAGTALCL